MSSEPTYEYGAPALPITSPSPRGTEPMANEDKDLEQELREIQEEQQRYGGCNNCQGQYCPDCN